MVCCVRRMFLIPLCGRALPNGTAGQERRCIGTALFCFDAIRPDACEICETRTLVELSDESPHRCVHDMCCVLSPYTLFFGFCFWNRRHGGNTSAARVFSVGTSHEACDRRDNLAEYKGGAVCKLTHWHMSPHSEMPSRVDTSKYPASAASNSARCADEATRGSKLNISLVLPTCSRMRPTLVLKDRTW